jgi:hypothetical protein
MLARSHAAELPRPRVMASNISRPEGFGRERVPFPHSGVIEVPADPVAPCARKHRSRDVRRRLYALSSLFDWYIGSN